MLRRIRALVVTMACVLAGVLGFTGSTLADPSLVPPALVAPIPGGSALIAPDPTAPSADPDDEPTALAEPVPRTSYATRHVPTPEEAALTGAVHPATDRVMALLVGWVLIALVGGGLLAGRDGGRRLEDRLEL